MAQHLERQRFDQGAEGCIALLVELVWSEVHEGRARHAVGEKVGQIWLQRLRARSLEHENNWVAAVVEA